MIDIEKERGRQGKEKVKEVGERRREKDRKRRRWRKGERVIFNETGTKKQRSRKEKDRGREKY